MIGYVTLGTNDLSRATAFYDQLFAAMGGKRVWESERGVAWGTSMQAPSVGVMTPFDGRPATVGNGTMVALVVGRREDVDSLYALAIELGATDEGKPGERLAGFHAAYFRDLDGNKLNFFHMG
ncbi:MAG: VOC family protein [Dechloromonas sp.]|uniref:VOC family protein n=1 Tax=Candidatus Dechloromonas phosphorivorans TaxID=2899244 RepID=A0A9D7LQM7_9RHOO|nr:VOC family protein [Candidatus Dechloromonas phosphorivorans]